MTDTDNIPDYQDDPHLYPELMLLEAPPTPQILDDLFKAWKNTGGTFSEEMNSLIDEFTYATYDQHLILRHLQKITYEWLKRINQVAAQNRDNFQILQHIIEMQNDHFYNSKTIEENTPDLTSCHKLRIIKDSFHEKYYYKPAQNQTLEFKFPEHELMIQAVSARFFDDLRALRQSNIERVFNHPKIRAMSTEVIRILAAERDLHEYIARHRQLGQAGTKPAHSITAQPS